MTIQQLDEDIKTAMLEKHTDRLRAIRALKAAALKAKQEKSKDEDLTSIEFINVVRKQIKQRRESADIYNEQKRFDLAGVEEDEIIYLEAYAPAVMSEELVRKVVTNVISMFFNTPGHILSMKDMKQVMEETKLRIGSEADPAVIGRIAKELLTAK